MRVLLTGWPSFVDGEATAGDLLSMRRVADALAALGVPADQVHSPNLYPGGPDLATVDPDAYSHLVFACGPAHGEQVRALHRRFARCRRIAVGVSVVDPADPAVTGFHHVLPRDDATESTVDLSVGGPAEPVPVVGAVFAPGQREYGERRRHHTVHDTIRKWLCDNGCAVVELDSRVDPAQWRNPSTPEEFLAVLRRMDAVVTTRLHGLVLALRAGVPALAVDPVAGGGKVTAQAHALRWPALLPAGQVSAGELDGWLRWCRSPEAARLADDRRRAEETLTGRLATLLREESR
ncbi:polysaccharide pyruvyl transferase family protein [Amycolatopsis suaedae]|uniref:Polysaccharide pyruvyl transferase family protein n=1 Tax=Amycolatopsis suaedae TaxID=2510978 RepID=A0A4Q7J0A8_9PSEU|nr:polysaccharide pyruvyl transferase family protein [Amycolatopsis suaedae]RZQ60229.1 polysaccharide pyruvyl transferase family protein [Amycolatopsis suaedae]